MLHLYTSDSIQKLVNETVIEFYDFADNHLNAQLSNFENNIMSFSTYILIKLLHDIDVNIFIFEISSFMMTIESVEFRHNERDNKYVKFFQFSFTLIYAITDYKCQELTFE